MNNFNDIFDDDLEILEIIDFGFPRNIYTRSHHFDTMDELNFHQRFRLTKQSAARVLSLIEEKLTFQNNMNNSVSPMDQLLLTLRFYASSCHLTAIADFGGMHTSTASRIIARVTVAIASLRPQFVKMPGTPEQIGQNQKEFFEIAGFPKVIGVVGGTHVRIQSPGGPGAETFRNKKGYFSINVQVISNANLEIMDIVARWPGSAHDSMIFKESRICSRFESGEFFDALLLGDSRYPIRFNFLTPLADPTTRPQQKYNEAHKRTCATVDRLIGNWKRRFPILAFGLRLKLETTLALIVATGVLHNIARDMHDEAPPQSTVLNELDLEMEIEKGNIQVEPINNSSNLRDDIIYRYFDNL